MQVANHQLDRGHPRKAKENSGKANSLLGRRNVGNKVGNGAIF